MIINFFFFDLCRDENSLLNYKLIPLSLPCSHDLIKLFANTGRTFDVKSRQCFMESLIKRNKISFSFTISFILFNTLHRYTSQNNSSTIETRRWMMKLNSHAYKLRHKFSSCFCLFIQREGWKSRDEVNMIIKDSLKARGFCLDVP